VCLKTVAVPSCRKRTHREHRDHTGMIPTAHWYGREAALAAVQQNAWLLQHASDTLCNDREVVLAAVQQNAWLLHSASDTPRNDREVVLAAVHNNGRALRYASDTLRNDREVVLAAVQQDVDALHYASDALRNNTHLRHLSQIASRGKRRWHHAKVWAKLYLSLWKCLELSSRKHYDAQFVNGKPVLVGKYAIDAKRTYDEAFTAVRELQSR